MRRCKKRKILYSLKKGKEKDDLETEKEIKRIGHYVKIV